MGLMFIDESNRDRIDTKLSKFFERYSLRYYPTWKLSKLPVQRCSDKNYISDQYVLDCYRNLHYDLIKYQNYSNQVINGMVQHSCWLVSSMSQKGVQSPLNMYDWKNIHPGKKRYIVANYLNLKTVPVLAQHPKDEIVTGGILINNLADLQEIYQNNLSVKIREKCEDLLIECSWHGETNRRDANGYDDWYSAAASLIGGKNIILEYLLENGLHVQYDFKSNDTIINSNKDIYVTKVYNRAYQQKFFIEIPDMQYLNKDLWKLYFHFDPIVGIKECTETGIRIVNKFGNLENKMKVNLKKTLERNWISDPEAAIE